MEQKLQFGAGLRCKQIRASQCLKLSAESRRPKPTQIRSNHRCKRPGSAWCTPTACYCVFNVPSFGSGPGGMSSKDTFFLQIKFEFGLSIRNMMHASTHSFSTIEYTWIVITREMGIEITASRGRASECTRTHLKPVYWASLQLVKSHRRAWDENQNAIGVLICSASAPRYPGIKCVMLTARCTLSASS
jgi:hypothetical protein